MMVWYATVYEIMKHANRVNNIDFFPFQNEWVIFAISLGHHFETSMKHKNGSHCVIVRTVKVHSVVI